MLLVDYSNLDTEATCLAQLGNFAKLPTEIRLVIWEALFKKQKISAPELGTNILSILCCSRYLYHEVSHLAYEDMIHDIYIHTPQAAEIIFVVNISSKRLLQIRTETRTKHIREHILNFPHYRLRNSRLGLNITHHCQRDFGQMINLWHAINKLIDALNDIEDSSQMPGPYVCIRLQGKWDDEGTPRQSIRDTRSDIPYRYDHDIAILPFARLPNTKWECTFPSNLWAIIAKKKDSLSHRAFYKLPNLQPENSETLNAAHKRWAYDNTPEIQRWLTDTRIFLDNALDTTPGISARILRRERFQNWYEDGNTWNSAYEEQFESDLTNNRDIVMKYDPNLNKARQRHEMLIIWHHLVHAPEDDKELMDATYLAKNRTLYTTWNSRAWFRMKAYGTERIDQGDMTPFCNHSYIYQDYKRRSGMKASSFELFVGQVSENPGRLCMLNYLSLN